MAEETESKEISSATVIGIGVVLFVVIVGIWYLFLKNGYQKYFPVLEF